MARSRCSVWLVLLLALGAFGCAVSRSTDRPEGTGTAAREVRAGAAGGADAGEGPSWARLLVKTPDGGPAPNVAVTLRGTSGLERSGATDADGGAAVLGPLPAGPYDVEWEGPLHRARRLAAPPPAATAEALAHEEERFLRGEEEAGPRYRKQVDLAPGDNSVELTLLPELLISGSVLDPAGRPLRRWAPVELFSAGSSYGVSADPQTGAFSAIVDTPGPWELEVVVPALGGALAVVTAPAEGVKLKLGPRAGVKVRVRAGGRPLPEAQVAVTIDSQRRRDQRAAEARLFGLDPKAEEEPPAAVLQTDAQGRAVARGLEPGQAVVEAIGPELRPAKKAVRLVDGKVAEVELELESAAAIEGLVVDGAGKGLQAEVMALPGQKSGGLMSPRGKAACVSGDWGTGAMAVSSPELSSQDRSDEKTGAFRLGGLDSGATYRLQVKASGFRVLTTTVAAPAKGLRLVLAPAAVVRGRVVDASGKPVTNASIEGNRIFQHEGRFQLDCEGDRVTLAVRALGFARKSIEVSLAQPTTDLGDVRLEPGPRATGRVVGEGGSPVAGATVSCEGCRPTTSGADGAFTLALPDAPAVVRADRSERAGIAESDGRTPVEVRLGGPTRVEGVAHDASGRPAKGSVRAVRFVEAGYEFETFELDGSGRFQGELLAGLWHFTIKGTRLDQPERIFGAVRQVVLRAPPAEPGPR